MSEAHDASVRTPHIPHARREAWFWSELEHIRERWEAAEHSFAGEVAGGTLPRSALADWASEHDHVLTALLVAAEDAAAEASGLLGDALLAHAGVRTQQLIAWRAFAGEVGWGGRAAWYYGEDPYPSTIGATSRLRGDEDTELACRLVTLHTFALVESELGAALRPALSEHYELGGVAGRAFALATGAGAHQLGYLAAGLEGLGPLADPYSLLDHARAIARGYSHILDDLLP